MTAASEPLDENLGVSPADRAFRIQGPRWTRWPLWVSLALLSLVFGTLNRSLIPVYYLVVVLLAAPLLQRHQARIGARLQRIPGPPVVRFALVGYAAVIAEETLVGTLFMLQEGLNWGAWGERVGQFVGFNLLAFTGLIFGLYFAAKLFRLGPLDGWIIAGGFGLFAEQIPWHLIANPVAGAMLLLPTMVVYSVIFTPALLSLRPTDRGVRVWRAGWRAIIAWALMMVLSIAPVGGLMWLRAENPAWFPSCEYISCQE